MYDFKITVGNPDSTHRDQLIRDMIYVCCISDLSDKSRREFLDKAVSWPFSDKAENNINKSAKLKGCKYWSKEALSVLEKYNAEKESGGNPKSLESQLRHEHVVPRNIFIKAMEKHFKDVREQIQKIPNPDAIQKKLDDVFSTLQNVMNDNVIGCVVTKKEADLIDGKETNKKCRYKKKMPDEAYDSNDLPTNDYELFSKIKNPWARYTIIRDKLTIIELKWEKKGKGWGKYDIVNPNVLNTFQL